MTSKLTLSIKPEVIENAKRVSLKKGKSLSKIVEEYLTSLHQAEAKKESVVDRMTARLKGKIKIPIPQDYKEFIREERYKDLLAKHKSANK